MIFCSSCLPAAADAQFVECTSEQSHFIDGQPVFGLGLQEGENLHRGHPVSFLFIFGGMEVVKPLKLRNLTKKRLTDDEVKQKVVEYLRKNEFITRSVVQSICGMTRTTATRQIRRLCEENVLVNKGLQKQPIYFLKGKE